MSEYAIRVENLSKKYKIGTNKARYNTIRDSITNGLNDTLNILRGKKTDSDNIIWALKDINFEVKHGEVLGIIGRNGAGKSTLLKILSRITKPTTGRIELIGRVGSLLEVGTGFHPELTGRENIYLNGAILGMKRNEINKKFDEIVDFAEIEKFLDTPVKHFSSGMYMRLAFAVAAHLEPEVLVIDEVLAVGDSQFQKKCLGKMGRVAKEGRTILFVSHNMGAISDLCNCGLLLSNGKLINKSSISDIIKQYSQYNPNKNFWRQPNNLNLSEKTNHILRELRLGDLSNTQTNVIPFGEKINLKLTINSNKEEEIFIGIGVRDFVSNQIIHFNSKDQPIRIFTKLGENSIGVAFKNILNKGDYSLTIWIGNSFFLTQDYIKDCLYFTSDTTNIGNNSYNGSVIIETIWNVNNPQKV